MLLLKKWKETCHQPASTQVMVLAYYCPPGKGNESFQMPFSIDRIAQSCSRMIIWSSEQKSIFYPWGKKKYTESRLKRVPEMTCSLLLFEVIHLRTVKQQQKLSTTLSISDNGISICVIGELKYQGQPQDQSCPGFCLKQLLLPFLEQLCLLEGSFTGGLKPACRFEPTG